MGEKFSNLNEVWWGVGCFAYNTFHSMFHKFAVHAWS